MWGAFTVLTQGLLKQIRHPTTALWTTANENRQVQCFHFNLLSTNINTLVKRSAAGQFLKEFTWMWQISFTTYWTQTRGNNNSGSVAPPQCARYPIFLNLTSFFSMADQNHLVVVLSLAISDSLCWYPYVFFLTSSSLLFASAWFDLAVSIMRQATLAPSESTLGPAARVVCNSTVPSDSSSSAHSHFIHCLFSSLSRLSQLSFNDVVSFSPFHLLSCHLLFSLSFPVLSFFFIEPLSVLHMGRSNSTEKAIGHWDFL